MEWTPWTLLNPSIVFTPRDLRETLDGGQAFRWYALDSKADPESRIWRGIWSNLLVELRLRSDQRVGARVPTTAPDSALESIESYLGTSIDWDTLRDELPWRSDPRLALCLKRFPTLRLLSQRFPEALLAFLCSATKRIPQIKIMCDNLANSLGDTIAPGFQALPTWMQIACASEQDLRKLGLGFRAKNIKRSADLIASDPNLLTEIEAAPYPLAKERLLQLPGVGSKIADCALLFGAGKLQAFPVDTWILRTMALRYGLEGWSPLQIEHFGRLHFGAAAGYAQQFLFAAERSPETRAANES